MGKAACQDETILQASRFRLCLAVPEPEQNIHLTLSKKDKRASK